MTPAAPPLVSVLGATVTHSRWGQIAKAVSNVSFEVFAGQWVLLVGHNGAGKTTLLNAIAGRAPLVSGDIRIKGRSIRALRERQRARLIFLVHQDPLIGTAPLLTIYENLLVADPVTGSKRDRARRYEAMLDPLGLSDRLDQPVKILSGGERQLLALTIARMRRAPLVLLDEPLAALDPSKVNLCIREIDEMRKEGSTIIQIAHDLSLLRSRADQILTLKDGQLVSDRAKKIDL